MDRRWYDSEPACSKLVLQLKNIQQPEIRDFCAKVMIHFCERIRKAIAEREKFTSRVKSLGVSGLSSLYKGRNRMRRWYDNLPEGKGTQQAIGQLYTLPMEGLTAIGFKLGDTFGLMQIYSAVCYHLEQPPSQEVMIDIALTALQSGQKEAKEVLISIVGQELYDALSQEFNHPNY